MRTSPVAIIMFFLAALLGAVGQFLYKSGAERAGGSALSSHCDRLTNDRTVGRSLPPSSNQALR